MSTSKKKQPIQATLPRVAPAKKPTRKAKPAKKPARQTEFQAHGEIVWEKRAQPAPASPPMIRLRLPSEKPTMEDTDFTGDIIVFYKCSLKPGTFSQTQSWDRDFSEQVVAWAPGRLPDGILPREPSQEERWQQEFSEWWTKTGHTDHNGLIADAAWQGFLAAKKGGAE